MNPVHSAMVGIILPVFGLVTPPYGLRLMICCAIAKVRLMIVLKDVMILLLPKLISPDFLKQLVPSCVHSNRTAGAACDALRASVPAASSRRSSKRQ